MTGDDWLYVGLIAAILGLAALVISHVRTVDADRRHWQRSTAGRQRTEAEVRADLAAAKEARELVAQHCIDLTFHNMIAAEFPADIPHQTRRTEEDQ